MDIKTEIVDLDQPAEIRWQFLQKYTEEINELLAYYLNDFEGSGIVFEGIQDFKGLVIPQDYLKEIAFIASISTFSENEVLIANLYYDALKFYFGCSAFAVPVGGTVYHARNLDWHTENNLLSKHTVILDFRKKNQTVCKTVGWYGFVGALSGIRPGCFSITLNAVLSNDNPEVAYPVSFLIRDVLTQETDFSSARKKLEKTDVVGDSLILLSGTEDAERAVIERTPKRFSTRLATKNDPLVTNDYKVLQNTDLKSGGALQGTSCKRFDRATELLHSRKIQNAQDCLTILQDKDIMMGITVQQMCFNNKTGEILLVAK